MLNFCTIRNQQQQQKPDASTAVHANNNNNNSSHNFNNNNVVASDDVMLFGQTSGSELSCSKCRQESNCQKPSQPSDTLSSHNYQSLYQIAPSLPRASNRRQPYTTLDALNQDYRGNCH
jgi:hypothetical protein